MTEVGVHEAKTNLSHLLRRVAEGEEIVVGRGKEQVARLVPMGAPSAEPVRDGAPWRFPTTLTPLAGVFAGGIRALRYLPDTHVGLWMLAAPQRIRQEIWPLLMDPDQELLLSAASSWETAIKYRLQRLELSALPAS